ncbi:HAD family hydrolase [Nocardia brasiliensis]|uniref:HAD family hydrolase n=1 Tax=Nocardia brasiliensis TaxID=37326 RepID=UPI003D17D6E2
MCGRNPGRTPTTPTRLKPDPHLLCSAMNDLNARGDISVFIGYSVSDIEAAHAAQIPVVAFANRPEKVARSRAHAPTARIRWNAATSSPRHRPRLIYGRAKHQPHRPPTRHRHQPARSRSTEPRKAERWRKG